MNGTTVIAQLFGVSLFVGTIYFIFAECGNDVWCNELYQINCECM